MPKKTLKTLSQEGVQKISAFPNGEPEPLEANTLIVENESLREGFTVIPNYILRDPTISVGAKLIYTLLLSYAWQEGRELAQTRNHACSGGERLDLGCSSIGDYTQSRPVAGRASESLAWVSGLCTVHEFRQRSTK